MTTIVQLQQQIRQYNNTGVRWFLQTKQPVNSKNDDGMNDDGMILMEHRRCSQSDEMRIQNQFRHALSLQHTLEQEWRRYKEEEENVVPAIPVVVSPSRSLSGRKRSHPCGPSEEEEEDPSSSSLPSLRPPTLPYHHHHQCSVSSSSSFTFHHLPDDPYERRSVYDCPFEIPSSFLYVTNESTHENQIMESPVPPQDHTSHHDSPPPIENEDIQMIWNSVIVIFNLAMVYHTTDRASIKAGSLYPVALALLHSIPTTSSSSSFHATNNAAHHIHTQSIAPLPSPPTYHDPYHSKIATALYHNYWLWCWDNDTHPEDGGWTNDDEDVVDVDAGQHYGSYDR